jgi:programmed cell death protein 5
MVLTAKAQRIDSMSENPDEDRLEELRQEKMDQLRDQEGGGAREEAAQAQREQAEAQKKAVLRKHLTDGARQRLNSVKMSKPQFGEQVEQQILAIAQSGRIQGKIDEEKMKQLLKELKPDDSGYNIRRR